MSETSLKLFSEGNGVEYPIEGGKDADISGMVTYVKAEVLEGKWVLYAGKGFPYNCDYMILETEGEHMLPFSPKSAKILPYKVNGLALFSAPHYTGTEQVRDISSCKLMILMCIRS